MPNNGLSVVRSLGRIIRSKIAVGHQRTWPNDTPLQKHTQNPLKPREKSAKRPSPSVLEPIYDVLSLYSSIKAVAEFGG